jgi:hypothetical protein
MRPYTNQQLTQLTVELGGAWPDERQYRPNFKSPLLSRWGQSTINGRGYDKHARQHDKYFCYFINS